MSNEFKDFPGYTGWVPDKPDDRDFPYEPIGQTPWGSEINLRDKFKDYLIPIYDQGQTGTCTANATAAAYSLEYNRFKAKKGDSTFFPSRAFIHYNGIKGEGVGKGQQNIPNEGSAIRLAMRSLQRFGVCQEISWPFRAETIRWYPGPYAYFEAQRPEYTIPQYSYKRLDVKRWDNDHYDIIRRNDIATMDKDGDTLLRNLRSCLSSGHPVVFGVKCYFLYQRNDGSKYFHMDWKEWPRGIKWELKEVPKDRRHIGPITDPKADPSSSSHAVVAVGFRDYKEDKTGQKGWVICQNSWGDDDTKDDKVAGRPLFWIPYSYITDFSATQDFWMMDLSSPALKSKI
jgi:hypothetical protein